MGIEEQNTPRIVGCDEGVDGVELGADLHRALQPDLGVWRRFGGREELVTTQDQPCRTGVVERQPPGTTTGEDVEGRRDAHDNGEVIEESGRYVRTGVDIYEGGRNYRAVRSGAGLVRYRYLNPDGIAALVGCLPHRRRDGRRGESVPLGAVRPWCVVVDVVDVER